MRLYTYFYYIKDINVDLNNKANNIKLLIELGLTYDTP